MIATGTVVISRKRRSTVALAEIPAISTVIDHAVPADSSTVPFPHASGAGTSRSTVWPPIVTRRRGTVLPT